jgi:transcriptional regulator with XRE-family HTH domain
MAQGMDEFAAREVGARIAQARHAKGLTQEQLAMIASFSKRSLQDYERGVSVPYRHMRELSSLLGPPVEWFLYGEQPPRMDEDLKRLVASELLPAIESSGSQERLFAGR